MTHSAEDSQPTASNPYKMLFFALLMVLLLAGIASGAYYLGLQKSTVVPGTTSTVLNGKMGNETATPAPSMATTEGTIQEAGQPDKDLVTQGVNTVSFTRKGKAVLLKYRGKIYDESNQGLMEEKKDVNAADFTWYGLVDAPANVPAGEFMYDEVFGLQADPSGQNFAFIMRWGTNKTNNDYIAYYLYYYTNETVNGAAVQLLKKFDYSFGQNYVPKIRAFSNNGQYISLNMFPCWNCGGGSPTLGLINLQAQFHDIGEVSYFVWTGDTTYEYKEYKTIPCTGEGEHMGPCVEDPKNLPMKTGDASQ